uniref:Uncharacterized protein n=1 Tax=Clytia hemisphaerica TaxID=252671 RepID=A0A7M5XKV6_9CNID
MDDKENNQRSDIQIPQIALINSNDEHVGRKNSTYTNSKFSDEDSSDSSSDSDNEETGRKNSTFTNSKFSDEDSLQTCLAFLTMKRLEERTAHLQIASFLMKILPTRLAILTMKRLEERTAHIQIASFPMKTLQTRLAILTKRYFSNYERT